jgi:hypothetical protein
MITCRVKPGRRFGAFKQYGPGDVVEIDAAALPGLADKLEQVPDLPVFISEASLAPEGNSEPQDGLGQKPKQDEDEDTDDDAQDTPDEDSGETEEAKVAPLAAPKVRRVKAKTEAA